MTNNIPLKNAQVGDDIVTTFKGKVTRTIYTHGAVSLSPNEYGVYAQDDTGYSVYIGGKDAQHYDITITKPEPTLGSLWRQKENDLGTTFQYVGHGQYIFVSRETYPGYPGVDGKISFKYFKPNELIPAKK